LQICILLQALTDEAQCLFLRLFLRKGPWFRLSTLAYSELTDIPMSAQQLCQADMATPLYPNPASSTNTAAKTRSPPQTAATAAAAAAFSPAGPGTCTSQAAVLSIGSDEQTMQDTPCSLVQAASCSVQLVIEVAETLTVAELQLLMGKVEVGMQGRTTGVSKGQMLQLLKAGLDNVEGSAAEVSLRALCAVLFQIVNLACVQLLPVCLHAASYGLHQAGERDQQKGCTQLTVCSVLQYLLQSMAIAGQLLSAAGKSLSMLSA